MHPVLGAVNAHGAVWERRVSDPIALPKCARMRVWWQHGSWDVGGLWERGSMDTEAFESVQGRRLFSFA
jgi:hypothetical protein